MSKYVYYAADFETTVYDGQKTTEVWAGGICPVHGKDDECVIFNSISKFFQFLYNSHNKHMAIFFHNLKFDGSFIVSELMKRGFEFISVSDNKPIPKHKFTALISDMGQWYSIRFTYGDHDIIIYDSLKLLPFSIKKIAKDFNLSHQKLTMKYEGRRAPGGVITPAEEEYLKADVLILKEAIGIFLKEYGFSMTSASAAMSFFRKKCIDAVEWSSYFPNVHDMEIDEELFGSPNVDAYIRKAYHGGYCYKARVGDHFFSGCTYDVNSLYPSMMLGESGNRYPVGKPTFFKGKIPDQVLNNDQYYYFVRFRTMFHVKQGYLPTIQIKDSYRYDPTAWLESSDIRYYDRASKSWKYSKYYKDLDGKVKTAEVTLTLTMTDFELFKEHYNTEYIDILDGCYFRTAQYIFDQYIDFFRKIKENSKGAPRALAKLFLNSLYGKFATSVISSYMFPISEPGEALRFQMVYEENKKPVYLPVGAAITSYARCYTIRAAQANYHGKDKPGFIYADTDSIHLDIPPEEVKGITVHDTHFGGWKLEAEWAEGIYIRQKTYMDVFDDGSVDIKCAGMPDRCKMLLSISLRKKLRGKTIEDFRELELDEVEKAFTSERRGLEEFSVGLIIPGKLLAKQYPGGILLQKTSYELRTKR